MCRGLLGVNSSVQLRQNRKDALKEADVIVLAGKKPQKSFRLDQAFTSSRHRMRLSSRLWQGAVESRKSDLDQPKQTANAKGLLFLSIAHFAAQ